MKDQVKGTTIRNVRFPFDGFVTLKRLFCWLCRASVDDEESEKKEGTHIRAHTFFSSSSSYVCSVSYIHLYDIQLLFCCDWWCTALLGLASAFSLFSKHLSNVCYIVRSSPLNELYG